MKFKAALLCLLAAAGSANALACYTVLDRANRVVYSSEDPPVDMSRPLHETLPQRFPGGHMVFDATAAACPAVAAGTPVTMQRQPAGSSSPLLTDTATASSMRLPHVNVAGNIAVVPAAAVANVDLPTFTVIPSDTTLAAAAGSTQVMGAAPAPTAIRNRDGSIASLRDAPGTSRRRY